MMTRDRRCHRNPTDLLAPPACFAKAKVGYDVYEVEA